MRSVVTMCVMTAMSAAVATTSAAETPLNLLFFGNSFTQGYAPGTAPGGGDLYYNVPDAIKSYATADGHVAPRIVQETLGGSNLSYHVTQAQTKPQETVANTGGSPWSYVVLQDESLRPADKTSDANAIAQFRADSKTLSDLVRANNSPSAATIMYQTWARGPVSTVYPNTYSTPGAMQTDLTKNYALAGTSLNTAYGYDEARVAPVGDAFGTLNFDSALLYNADARHSTVFGYRLSAAVLYRTIYNEKISDIPYSAVQSWIGLTAGQYAQIQSVADSVAIPEPAAAGAAAVGASALLGRRRASVNR
ncbi:MAG: uncharacterized protein JWM57_3168 [Phycisphaerales bacterium]|nr:uncharacterized protein [Phycisphaerales bacterium]